MSACLALPAGGVGPDDAAAEGELAPPGASQIDPDLTLSDRTYACTDCGLVIDRDLNAATDLARYDSGDNPTASPPLTAAA